MEAKVKKFVKVQKDILASVADNQLVSAGAGSGKTTVMIEKIGNLLINDKIDINSLLVVTFTVLAAGEMKDKLVERLKAELIISNDKERILDLIEQIKTASIDTIDGFSSKTIKKYFYELGLNPNLEIVSDTTKDYYVVKAMDKTFKDFAKEHDEINILLDFFGGNKRNLDKLKDLVLSNFYNIINIGDYSKFLLQSLKEYQGGKSEDIINTYICNNASETISGIIDNVGEVDENVKAKVADYVGMLNNLNKNIGLKSNLVILKGIKLEKFTIKECKQFVQLKDVNKYIDGFNCCQADLLNNGIDENYDVKNEQILKYFPLFIELLNNFVNNYKKLKQEYNLIDFNDLNRLMLKLLENEKIKYELQSKFKYVFIDEYQDVNPLQEKLLMSLVGKDTKLFMVGDVKQSIYGFRGATPEGFIGKYNKYKQNENLGTAFDMNVNFRSNPKILLFINELFSKLMTVKSADVDYEHTSEIDPQREDIIDDKVEIILTKTHDESVVETGVYSVKNAKVNNKILSKQQEAFIVLDKITKLVGTKFYDANLKQERILTYKDIAILSRAEKDEATICLVELLRSANIPVSTNNKLDIGKSEIIKLVLSILKCVINTADDVDYLATFVAITDLTFDEVFELRNKEKSFAENLRESNNEKVLYGFNILKDIKQASYTKDNAELISYILNDKKLKYYIISHENGEQELNLLLHFVDKLTVEKRLSLAEFIAVAESSLSKGTDYNESDREDSVTVETIHKSKGLEYPVVFLFNTSKMFNYLKDNDGINFNGEIGLGVDYFDPINRVKLYSVPKFAINLLNKEKGYKEELRLLYVALTRAKNKLIITGQYTDKMLDEKDFKKTSFCNMILSCFINNLNVGENEFEHCKFNLLEDETVVLTNTKPDREVIMLENNFVYPNQDKFNIPVKNSVTGLNSQKVQASKFDVKNVLNVDNQYDEYDKALIGTHYHKALELLDFEKPYNKNSNFEDVDYKKIQQAYNVLCPLFNKYEWFKKEAEFMMFVPYNQLVKSDISDKVLVQGVCDLIICYGDHIDIIDYKFSNLPIKTLKEKYAEQLKLYKMAVEKAYNKRVEHLYIYSINSGELA